MRLCSFLLVLAVVGIAVAVEPKVYKEDFEGAEIGQLPKGWSAAQAGEGKGSVWKIVEDSKAPKGSKALAQLAESPGSVFNLCIADETSFHDGEIAVSFKAVKGATDQGGGLAWRYLDANNYYVARMNPLEDNFRLYKVVNGKRTQLATKDSLDVPVGQWHTISVTMKGDQIACSLEGKKYLEAKDGTFTKPGKVGLWTKADAQTHFDDFRVSTAK